MTIEELKLLGPILKAFPCPVQVGTDSAKVPDEVVQAVISKRWPEAVQEIIDLASWALMHERDVQDCDVESMDEWLANGGEMTRLTSIWRPQVHLNKEE